MSLSTAVCEYQHVACDVYACASVSTTFVCVTLLCVSMCVSWEWSACVCFCFWVGLCVYMSLCPSCVFFISLHVLRANMYVFKSVRVSLYVFMCLHVCACLGVSHMLVQL